MSDHPRVVFCHSHMSVDFSRIEEQVATAQAALHKGKADIVLINGTCDYLFDFRITGSPLQRPPYQIDIDDHAYLQDPKYKRLLAQYERARVQRNKRLMRDLETQLQRMRSYWR